LLIISITNAMKQRSSACAAHDVCKISVSVASKKHLIEGTEATQNSANYKVCSATNFYYVNNLFLLRCVTYGKVISNAKCRMTVHINKMHGIKCHKTKSYILWCTILYKITTREVQTDRREGNIVI
jgi:hypothetical protein